MRKLSLSVGAATLCIAASLANGQQLPTFKTGDPVDFFSLGKWMSCTVASPLKAGAYDLQCGTLQLRARADANDLRAHVAPDYTASNQAIQHAVEVSDTVSRTPIGESIGSHYGTREPRTCAFHTATITDADARELLICDAEHEFGGQLFLVSNVSLLVSNPRTFSATEDSGKPAIDAAQPVYDIRASYDNYQCSRIPSSYHDFPGSRNCNQYKMTNAAGSCFRNTAGDWHCLMYQFHSGATSLATATNVRAPLAD